MIGKEWSKHEVHLWPGKSGNELYPEHPAAYHMLDVAAVAEKLTDRFDLSPPVREALLLLIALHDIGKVSDSFRRMLREGVPQTHRHWVLSEILLLENDGLIGQLLGGTEDVRHLLYAAVAGHHGVPPSLDLGTPQQRTRQYQKALGKVGAGMKPANDLISHFANFWPNASLDGLSLEKTKDLSWWLPGLCTAADWIGSNASWFKPQPSSQPLEDYLAATRDSAKLAIEAAGLKNHAISATALFSFAYRPMQQACNDTELPEGPTLAIIEDETGSGKTEAALILAQRMLLAGKGEGLYFALPTMATADAMFNRARESVGRLFATAPSLTLAHGKAGLSVPFRDLVQYGMNGPEATHCSDWLADDRRRCLMANVGVGTIDQALLSVLPVRFQTLRHFGLSSKVLIVDEVHELGEPYIAAELEALLKLHRATGGSAILLTATLPLALRRRLLATYDGHADSTKYPALTIAGNTQVKDLPQTTGPRGDLRIKRLSAESEVVDSLVKAACAGAACAWIRNAVDDAIKAVMLLKERGIDAELLHARFALSDRKRVEAEALSRFGKTGVGRSGRVLVGTQVLESSLDLDFDVMVSDLAPIAALIQRAGRLWRHMDLRPQDKRPIAGPVLQVLSPDPALVESDRWLHDVLEKGAFVYSQADQWRTAKTLFAVGKITAPSGLRDLIEAVHGDNKVPPPDALLGAENTAIGNGHAAHAQAIRNIVDLTGGYRQAGGGDDDARYPTRLGRPQRTLVLARMDKGLLRPWAEGVDEEAWMLSEVSASRHRLDNLPLPDQNLPEISAVREGWPVWKKEQTKLCPVDTDGRICDGLRYSYEWGLVFE